MARFAGRCGSCSSSRRRVGFLRASRAWRGRWGAHRTGQAGTQAGATRQDGADPAAAILAKHKAADDEYAKAVMSPFTAVAVQYFQPGQTIRMAVGPAGVAFGPAAAGVDVVELTLQDGAYFVAPVAGACRDREDERQRRRHRAAGHAGDRADEAGAARRRAARALLRRDAVGARERERARVRPGVARAQGLHRVEVVPAQPRAAGEGALRGEPDADRGDHHDEPRPAARVLPSRRVRVQRGRQAASPRPP